MQELKIAIIGSGPAGYTAGLYAARAKLEPSIFTGIEMGGQLMYTTEIENFPGLEEGVIGPKLMQSMQNQATKFGSKLIAEVVVAVDFSKQPFKLWTTLPKEISMEELKDAKGETLLALQKQIKQQDADYAAEAVIISTGASSIMLAVPGEKKYFGKGLSVCAVCDAAFYPDKTVFVVGGGDSAMEDAMALSRYSKEVTVIHRRDSFKASKIMQERVLNNPNIKVMWNSQVTEVFGDGQRVSEIEVESNGQRQKMRADGLFLAIGHRPATQLFASELKLDRQGYVVTQGQASAAGRDLAEAELKEKPIIAYPSMTSVPGVFAAGDVADPHYKQAIFSAGMGCAAALDAERWLERRG